MIPYPVYSRVAVIMIVSFMIFPFTAFSLTQPPATLLHLLMVVFREIAIGYLMGFTVSALFAAVQFAGHVIGLQMGLAVATVIDPMGAGQISIFGEFYYLISLLVFLGINAHHYVIEALVHSFTMVPVGMLTFSSSLAEFLITLTGMIFIVAIKLAGAGYYHPVHNQRRSRNRCEDRPPDECLYRGIPAVDRYRLRSCADNRCRYSRSCLSRAIGEMHVHMHTILRILQP